MKYKTLRLTAFAVFLLSLLFYTFIMPVSAQTQTPLCYELSIVVLGSGEVWVSWARGADWGTWHRIATGLTPGSTFTRVYTVSGNRGIELATRGADDLTWWFVGVNHDREGFDYPFKSDPNAGSVTLLSYADASECTGIQIDGRLNALDVSVNASIYPYNDGYRIYVIDEATGVGVLSIDAGPVEISAALTAAVADRENQQIGSSADGSVSLWVLFNGQCQLNYAHFDGSPLRFAFDCAG